MSLPPSISDIADDARKELAATAWKAANDLITAIDTFTNWAKIARRVEGFDFDTGERSARQIRVTVETLSNLDVKSSLRGEEQSHWQHLPVPPSEIPDPGWYADSDLNIQDHITRDLSYLNLILKREAQELVQQLEYAPLVLVGQRTELEDDTTESGRTHDVLTWQEAAEKLERLRIQGEPFTSQGAFAKQLGCSKTTIFKAIDKTSSLHSWARPEKEPTVKAQSLNEVVTDKTPQHREPDPADSMDERDIEVAMEYLIAESEPEVRAQIHSMPPDKQRELARLLYADPEKHEKILARRA